MFLISQGDPEFTAEDVRADIGLATDKHDELIRVGIHLTCAMMDRAVRSTWAVSIDDFDRTVSRMGEPSKIGGLYLYSAKYGHFRDLTWDADPDAVAKARAKAGRWAAVKAEIAQSLFEERNPDLAGYSPNYAHFNSMARADRREGRAW